MTEPPPTIDFPHKDYLIKIIGENTPDFHLQEFVVECVNRHVYQWDAEYMNVRRSKQGNYLSVTITCDIKSYNQLKALSDDLASHKHVRMVL